MRIAGPGFWNQHGHDVRQAASSLEKQFDGVVEVGGIAAIRSDDGEQFFQIVAKERRCEQRLRALASS